MAENMVDTLNIEQTVVPAHAALYKEKGYKNFSYLSQEGFHGTVYKATDGDNRLVAIKAPTQNGLTAVSREGFYLNVLAERGACHLADGTSYPYTPRVYERFTPNEAGIAMEYIDGVDVIQYREQNDGILPKVTMLYYLDFMQQCLTNNIIPNDLKAEDFLIQTDPQTGTLQFRYIDLSAFVGRYYGEPHQESTARHGFFHFMNLVTRCYLEEGSSNTEKDLHDLSSILFSREFKDVRNRYDLGQRIDKSGLSKIKRNFFLKYLKAVQDKKQVLDSGLWSEFGLDLTALIYDDCVNMIDEDDGDGRQIMDSVRARLPVSIAENFNEGLRSRIDGLKAIQTEDLFQFPTSLEDYLQISPEQRRLENLDFFDHLRKQRLSFGNYLDSVAFNPTVYRVFQTPYDLQMDKCMHYTDRLGDDAPPQEIIKYLSQDKLLPPGREGSQNKYDMATDLILASVEVHERVNKWKNKQAEDIDIFLSDKEPVEHMVEELKQVGNEFDGYLRSDENTITHELSQKVIAFFDKYELWDAVV